MRVTVQSWPDRVSDVTGKYYVPEVGAFLIYLVMIGLLMWRPAGLFGRR